MSMPPLNQPIERFSAPRRGGGITLIRSLDLAVGVGHLG